MKRLLLQVLAWTWVILVLSASFSEAADFDFELPQPFDGGNINAKITYHQVATSGTKKSSTPKPATQICGPQGDCVDANKGKHVVIEYNDFLKMVAMKEHSDKTRDKALAENTVLVKLKDEQNTVIQLQKEDIKACREIVKSHEQLGETEAQISKAVEAELRKGFATEKRLSRYKSEAFAVGIIAAVVWGMRR